MNEIIKKPLQTVGYNFIEAAYLPQGKDEYYLRDLQNNSGIHYRHLTAYEIEVLVRNNNTSDDWNKLQVSDAFNPELVKNCKFFGLVRIGKLEAVSLQFHNVHLPVGLYNSTIISCDFGDNVVVSNVNYISHYIVGDEVMISNVHELHTTNHSKFGNGILKDGEAESVRIWVEVCNENGGRSILPFDGMQPGDAYIWAKHRDDVLLMQQLQLFTESKFSSRRGYYGQIGDRTVIKNTSIIKDVWVGTDAYIKGANKLKNLTINSSSEAHTQIGEGCELVNGVIDYGCRVFYGVKAVRFVMASHSQLKYGARLINSYLGNNSTISCCEVLNSLIFPAHEQHHNNSFLCAALIMGQSNIAAGATIGSNHNSRAADGELVTGRGFWPGLCVSLKHNSKFACFVLIAKGDYNYELNITLPFSLISNDEANNRLTIMPAYWFMYNLYALERNEGKYQSRDQRTQKIQQLEYDYLAPDSVNEIFAALQLIEKLVAQSVNSDAAESTAEQEILQRGAILLSDAASARNNIIAANSGLENSNRPVVICKPWEAYRIYKKLIVYYGVSQLFQFTITHKLANFQQLMSVLPEQPTRQAWVNVGGQLMPQSTLTTLMDQIKTGEIDSWDAVHQFYLNVGRIHADQKLQHAFASLLEILNIKKQDFTERIFMDLLQQMVATKEWMVHQITASRAKDYQNPFKKMVYNSEEEMNLVMGRLDENQFIRQQQAVLAAMRSEVSRQISEWENQP